MSILLGLLSALFYGATDVVARVSSRRVGVLATMLWAQVGAALVLTAAVLSFPWPGNVPPSIWALLAVSDLLILGATALLFKALSMGRLSVVAPIAASYGGVTVIISAIFGESLAGPQWAGIAVLLAGNALVARPPVDTPASDHGLGLVPAAGAALLYGTGFWLQGAYVVTPVGSIVTVWSYYLIGAVLIGMIALRHHAGFRAPSARDLALGVATGWVAVLAYVSLTVGQRIGSIAIVTMLSSLASAFAVLFAAIFLKERIAPAGWAGVASILAGLILLQA